MAIGITRLNELEYKTLRQAAAALEPPPLPPPPVPKTFEITWVSPGKTESLLFAAPLGVSDIEFVVAPGKRNAIKQHNPFVETAFGKGKYTVVVIARDDVMPVNIVEV